MPPPEMVVGVEMDEALAIGDIERGKPRDAEEE
jgi:hypothetical protein